MSFDNEASNRDNDAVLDKQDKRVTMREARDLAEQLGYRIEKYVGEDKWLIRDLHTDVRVAKGHTFEGIVRWLERATSDREEGGRNGLSL